MHALAATGLASVLLLLAACGGREGGSAPAEPPASDPGPAGAEAPTAPPPAEEPAPVAAPAPTESIQRYDCGGTQVAVFQRGDEVQLSLGGRRIQLQPVAAASGARYEGQDEGRPVSFWSKGEEATLQLGDETLPTCRSEGDMQSSIYRALGQEPGWLLEYGEERLVVSLDYGQRTLTATSFLRVDEGEGFRLQGESEAGAVTVAVTRRLCHDGMSGLAYPDSVSLTLGEERYSGCGGDPKALLLGADWRIVEIDGAPALDGVEAHFRFGEDGRLTGKASCNQMSGQWSLGGEGLSLGPMAATKMYCTDAGVMPQEAAVLAVLNDTPRHDFDEQGRLLLSGQGGGRLVAVRESR